MTSQKFKEKCIDLRMKNYTLGEIVRELNRSKTSVYFHIKDIPKNPILISKIKKTSAINAKKCRFAKGISWKGRHCMNFEEWTPELVNLVAHAMFDGEIGKVRVIYYNRSLSLLNNFRNKISLIYNFEPIIRIDRRSGVVRLEYNSVELANLLREKSKELLKRISFSPLELKRQFLKAFFNDEGSVYFQKNKRKVKGYQHDKKILFIIKDLLKKFDIESRVSVKFYEITVTGRRNIEKFAKEINFSQGVSVNGNRSNSIWKKSLEKRKILRTAIESYENSNPQNKLL